MKRIPTPLLTALILAIVMTAAYAAASQLPSNQDLVYVRVTAVTTATQNNGRPVRGLRKEQFKVFEDNAPQEIVSVSEESLPLEVGILFHGSGATKSDVKSEALSGLKKFSGKDDEFFLMEPGKAPLNDAILQALNTLAQSDKNMKHALVLIISKSDPGEYSYSKVRERLKELDTQFYVAGLPMTSDISNDSARQALRELAEFSGGSAFFPSSTYQVDDVYRKIVTELRNQYRIAYRSTNSATDGKWRKIRITGEYRDDATRKVAKLNIHAKPGYYAQTAAK